MRIFVEGDNYNAYFLLRANSVKLPWAKPEVVAEAPEAARKPTTAEEPAAVQSPTAVSQPSTGGDGGHPAPSAGAPWSDKENILFSLRVGAAYLRAALRGISGGGAIELFRLPSAAGAGQEGRRPRLFEIRIPKKVIPDYDRYGETLPVFDVMSEGGPIVLPASLAPGDQDGSKEEGITKDDILLERIAGGELSHRERELLRAARRQAPVTVAESCRIHIQIGLTDFQGQRPGIEATGVRCIIVTLRDLALELRIRKSLSYESIVVDILRLLRNYTPHPDYTELFDSIAGTKRGKFAGAAPAELYIIVRINHAATLVYRWYPHANIEKERESSDVPDSAFLFFHQRHPAPMHDMMLGRVDGFSGFLAVHLAAGAQMNYMAEPPARPPNPPDLPPPLPAWITEAICAGILWQVAQHERGVLKLFFEDKSPNLRDPLKWKASADHPKIGRKGVRALRELAGQPDLPRAKAAWEPIETAHWGEARHRYFNELRRYLENEEKWKDGELSESLKRVKYVQLRVGNAVSHRTQWFLAGDWLLDPDPAKAQRREPASLDHKEAERLGKIESALADAKRQPNPKAEHYEITFADIAMKWLTLPPGDPRSDPKKTLPLVTIESLPLSDRREVEDYLALRDAIRNYEKAGMDKPLNIAVFGAPGAGKSFGVTQVVAHAASMVGSRLSAQPLSFNVSQFTALHDLVTALQLVRNEMLKGKIPVVFFDEFDSAFEGRPFGWLKYFLAPMQDGEFTDGGRIFRLGACVIVFAGGVNRSFEEMNGRLRNAGFVEAKGPDFISRLRAHMNIRGINKPEDDVDQSRYLLRRAIMLHGMLSRKLDFAAGNDREQGLLESSVARAFLRVASFKHGARSMEAILDMCDLQRGRPLGPSDLPAKAQLEMHVDASEFIDLVLTKPK
jgi:hypothetical protein